MNFFSHSIWYRVSRMRYAKNSGTDYHRDVVSMWSEQFRNSPPVWHKPQDGRPSCMKTARLSWRVRDNVVARATCGDWFDGGPATTLQQRIDEEMEEAGHRSLTRWNKP